MLKRKRRNTEELGDMTTRRIRCQLAQRAANRAAESTVINQGSLTTAKRPNYRARPHWLTTTPSDGRAPESDSSPTSCGSSQPGRHGQHQKKEANEASGGVQAEERGAGLRPLLRVDTELHGVHLGSGQGGYSPRQRRRRRKQSGRLQSEAGLIAALERLEAGMRRPLPSPASPASMEDCQISRLLLL